MIETALDLTFMVRTVREYNMMLYILIPLEDIHCSSCWTPQAHNYFVYIWNIRNMSPLYL